MSLPSLAAIPSLLLPLASRSQQSWRAAVAQLAGEQELDDWSPQRWAAFDRVSAASDFFIEQSLRDPLMLLEAAVQLPRAPPDAAGLATGASGRQHSGSRA